MAEAQQVIIQLFNVHSSILSENSIERELNFLSSDCPPRPAIRAKYLRLSASVFSVCRRWSNFLRNTSQKNQLDRELT